MASLFDDNESSLVQFYKMISDSFPATATYTFQPFRWTEEKARRKKRSKIRIPRPRSGHRIALYNSSICCFGGFNPHVGGVDGDDPMDGAQNESVPAEDGNEEEHLPLFKELWKFNVVTKLWTRMPILGSAPDQLASHSVKVVHIDGAAHLLSYGGTGAPFGYTASNSVFLCDLKRHRWAEMPAVPASNPDDEDGQAAQMPMKLYGQAIELDEDGNLYTVGGTTGFNYFMDVHRLDMGKRSWQLLHKAAVPDDDVDDDDFNEYASTEPHPRYRHEMCYYKRTLYVLGGGTSLHSYGFECLHGFNVDSRTWSLFKTTGDPSFSKSGLPEYPRSRRCHSSTQSGKYVYIVGGYNGEIIFPDLWRLDLESLSWIRLSNSMPEPVYFSTSAVTTGGKLFTFGGVHNILANSRTNRVHSCWTRICSLRDMCWEALNHYYPDLDEMPIDALLEDGIPADLVMSLHEPKQ